MAYETFDGLDFPLFFNKQTHSSCVLIVVTRDAYLMMENGDPLPRILADAISIGTGFRHMACGTPDGALCSMPVGSDIASYGIGLGNEGSFVGMLSKRKSQGTASYQWSVKDTYTNLVGPDQILPARVVSCMYRQDRHERYLSNLNPKWLFHGKFSMVLLQCGMKKQLLVSHPRAQIVMNDASKYQATPFSILRMVDTPQLLHP
ncbi:hypothetical protein V8C26DRAFT_194908 [Trichoderma gracile]